MSSTTPETPLSETPGTPGAAASATTPAPHPLTVGFDLDMTLIDSRPGIHATFVQLSRERGVTIDADLVVTRLGPPLEVELANWFPADEVDAAATRYRELYPDFAIAPALPMPGAREAIAAVRAAGGRSLVVSAKWGPSVQLHLDHLGIDADEAVGSLWAEGKAEALRAYGASIYVGDHLGDILGAHAAGAHALAVATGPISAADLAAAGADTVLDDLTAFPAWLAEHTARVGRG
jgi:phosphoglycolate phosphatase